MERAEWSPIPPLEKTRPMTEQLTETLLQLGQHSLHGLKVGQVLRRGGLLGVVDRAVLTDDKRGASGGVTHTGQHREQDPIGLGRFLVQIADQLNADLALIGPSLLRKGAVDADADDICIETGVLRETGRDVAQFLSADSGESQRNEQQDGVLGAKVGAELHINQTG